jgi:hypothetical protein
VVITDVSQAFIKFIEFHICFAFFASLCLSRGKINLIPMHEWLCNT